MQRTTMLTGPRRVNATTPPDLIAVPVQHSVLSFVANLKPSL
jgi:hypothetical protein